MSRFRGAALAIAISVLLAVAAVGAHLRANAYRSEARWLLLQSNAEAETYATTFESQLVDKQFNSFDLRREKLERAEAWQRAQMLLILAAVAGGFSSYVLYLLRKLRDQVVESTTAVKGLEDLPSRGPDAPGAGLGSRT